MMLLIALMLVTFERMDGRVDKLLVRVSRSGMCRRVLSFLQTSLAFFIYLFPSGTLYRAGHGGVQWCSRVYRVRGGL